MTKSGVREGLSVNRLRNWFRPIAGTRCLATNVRNAGVTAGHPNVPLHANHAQHARRCEWRQSEVQRPFVIIALGQLPYSRDRDGVEAEPDQDLTNQAPPDYLDDQRTTW